MQQLNDFLHHANYQPVFNAGIAGVGVAALVIIAILLVHTLHIMGRPMPFGGTYSPAKGWSRKFYPASGCMVIFLLMLMWLLNVWSHKVDAAR